MKRIQILNNQNKIYNEVTRIAHYANERDDFSIRLVLNGNEQYKLGNKSLKVYPGNFLVINEGTAFSREINSDIPVNSISILYASSFLSSFHHSITSSDSLLLDDPFITMPSPVFLETLYPLKGDMLFNLLHLKDLFNSDNNDDLLMNEYLFYSLLNFYRIYNREILAKSEQLNVSSYKTRTELFKRLNVAKDFMISNFNQALSVDDICQNSCLSETHFFRTFRQTFNCTPYQFLMHVRLTQAKYMLRNTECEVKDIVNSVGFNCTSSFIKQFKDRFGVTPGVYRVDSAA